MGTQFKGKQQEISSLNTYLKLIRAADSIRSRLNNYLVENGITENQFSVLDVLYHLGPTNQKELGKKLLRSGGNITLVIDNLEKSGLVKRVRGKEDRRQFIVEIEEPGKKLFKKIFPGFLDMIVETADILSAKEQKELQRLTKKIGLGKPVDD
ncbi:MAG: MarR family transcriptional regulator [Ignavibacteriales bacterium]|nr:MAG: MarR family transcriptional regulator [Ignavibacteriales bacterium]